MQRGLFSNVLRVLILVLVGTVPVLSQRETDRSKPVALEILQVSPDDLSGRSPAILGFDVSPNGHALAVEFIAADKQNEQLLQVGEWDLHSKKLMIMRSLEGPARGLMSNPQLQYDLRFTPDGLDLVVLTGSHVAVLDADTLTQLQVIGLPPEPGPPPQVGWVLDSFAISGDGSKLAVISRGIGPTCGDHSTFRLSDLKSGRSLGSWQFHGCAAGVSLSENGTLALMGLRQNQIEEWRGILADAATGNILRTFSGGGGVFLDNLHFLKAVGYPKPAQQESNALAVVDINSGNIKHEMHYAQYGVSGKFAVAPSVGIVAVMESWLNPNDLARDVTYARGFVRLILFHVSEHEPFYVSADIHDRPMFGSTYMARLSSEGAIVAYGGSTIHVLKMDYSSVTLRAE